MNAVKWPPFVTASKWGTIFDQVWNHVRTKRGSDVVHIGKLIPGFPPTSAPRLTNADVVTITMAVLAAVPTPRAMWFPFWDQFAAVAYKYSPPSTKLDATPLQAERAFPDALVVEFWSELFQIMKRLDESGVSNPRLDLDGRFSDRTFQGEVIAALRADNVDAQFKIPVACRNPDGTTRSPLLPKCKKRSPQWPYLCMEYEKCDDPVTIDDPITAIKNRADRFAHLVMLALFFWAVLDNKPRPSRRK